VSLFGGGGEGGASGLARPRLPEVEPFDPVRRLDEELAAIGFYLSGHPLDDMGPSLARRGVVLFADLPAKAAEGARAARMAAVVRRKQEKVSRRSGEKFAFVTLSDPSGEFEALVPPKVLREVRDILEPGGAVILAAKIEEQDEGLRLIIDGADVLDPNAAEHNGAGVRIHVDALECLDPLRKRIERADGREGPRGGVHLVVPLSDGRNAEIRLPGRHAIDPAARAAFKAVSGVLEVEQL
jgi:DNA polymerase-3 subunit alpha